MFPGSSQMYNTLHRDLKIPIIKEIIKEFCQRYRDRLEVHRNNLAAKNLMKAGGIIRRLKRKRCTDLQMC